MNARTLFLTAAAICLAAAFIIYLRSPDRVSVALVFFCVALVFGVLGVSRKAPST